MIAGQDITLQGVLTIATDILRSFDRLGQRKVKAVRFHESGLEAVILLDDDTHQKVNGLLATKMREVIA